ncbi:MATE family efflux transporter [uncultured Phascolarctobacterium sp.]|uniref:MATE family efflux transporter n=1 Tax=uncultured Phascolarctobacterium sp. TaxID=512296 RepID=UPI0027D94653|nr:MATE family efflux transporter [uncultured Phascolarctobacterium sp.]
MRTEVLTNREYLGLTIPFMLSTMTQPLMGAVNTAVMGQLPDPKYIAAVALGAILFNNIYWFFGFLRVSTSGYAAQALGSGVREASLLAFLRPLFIAMLVSCGCILLQKPILSAYLALVAPAADVAALCTAYYDILIWGAPLVLFNYVSLGWLMGQTRVRASVFMQVSSNVLNMALSMWFVFGLHFHIEGVAWATLLSQLYGAVVGCWLMYVYGDFDYRHFDYKKVIEPGSLLKMLSVNVNLMIRTACLLTVNNIIAAAGAGLGTVVLAANAVLFQLKDIMSYLVDGMANGAAIFSGRALGQKNRDLFWQTLRMTYKWLFVLVVVLMAGFGASGTFWIRCFTDIGEVAALAGAYRYYVLLYPLIAGIGLALYGMFTGATYTAPVRNMMMAALAVFWPAERLLVPLYGNDGLWLSYLLFVGTQSLILFLSLKKLRKKI